MMTRKPLTLNAGKLEQLPNGVGLDVGGWNLPTSGGTDNYVLVADASGNGEWVSDLIGLTLVTVDNISIDGATILSDTGAISFGDENLSTSGSVSGVNITSGEDPGHTHTAGSITEADPLSVHKDGSVDLTSNWTVSTNDITLTAGTLTAEHLTSTDDATISDKLNLRNTNTYIYSSSDAVLDLEATGQININAETHFPDDTKVYWGADEDFWVIFANGSALVTFEGKTSVDISRNGVAYRLVSGTGYSDSGGDANATNGGNFILSSGPGGTAISDATSSTIAAGNSGAFTLQSSLGGNALDSNSNNPDVTAGNSGDFLFGSNNGGFAFTVGIGTVQGGSSGRFTMYTGSGGTAIGGTATGGDSGDLLFYTGNAGIGTTPGNAGEIIFGIGAGGANYKAKISGNHFYQLGDNFKHYFGATNDAYIEFDSDDLIINSQNVGSGHIALNPFGGNVGIGSNADDNYAINIGNFAHVDPLAEKRGINISFVYSLTSNNNIPGGGIYSSTTLTGTGDYTNELAGISGFVRNSLNNKTAANITGFQGQADSLGTSAHTTNATGVKGLITMNAVNDTITNAYRFRGTRSTCLGTVTNFYGLYLDDVDQGVNNWAIYTGDGIVEFNDDVEIRQDNKALKLGGSNDAAIFYNSENLVIDSQVVGTGDLVLEPNGGNVLLGTATAPTANATSVMVFGDNAANPTLGTNTAGVFAKDVSGTVEMFAVDEASNVTQLSPHDPETGEWIFLSHNTRTGRTVRINMERMVRRFEELTGESFITETFN